MSDGKADDRPVGQFEAGVKDMAEHFAKANQASEEAARRIATLWADIQGAQAVIASVAVADDPASLAARLNLAAQSAVLTEMAAIVQLFRSTGQDLAGGAAAFAAAMEPLRIAWSEANAAALADLASKRGEPAEPPAPAARGLH